MSIGLFDGDGCLDEGVARAGNAIFNVEDTTEMLDEADGSLANAGDVGTLVEIIELDDIVASDGDVEVEPLIWASGLKRNPAPPSVKSDTLQQLVAGSGSNTL